ncbi:ABC transporter permease [Aminobacterium mobile]
MIDFIRATIRMSTPLLLTALGGTWTQQTGVLNISQEGAMLISAFFAVLGNYFFQSWIIGILFGMAAGLLFNMLFALLCVFLRANIWVVGMTLNILADSLSILLMKSIFHVKGGFRDPSMVRIPDINVPWLGDLSLIIVAALLLFFIFWFIDSKTVFGLRLKATGENEEALSAAGISPIQIRFKALAINGLMVGLAGAFLSTSYLVAFVSGMSAERGWLAVAAVIFGDGNLLWTAVGVLLFGAAQTLGIELQSFGFSSHLALMLPYILVIVALIFKNWKRMKQAQEA